LTGRVGAQCDGVGRQRCRGREPDAIALRSDTSGQFHTVTAGVSWHFTPTHAAMPWQGAFAGIHGGGAWGNSTNADYTGSQVFTSDVRLKHDITLVGRRSDGLGVYA